MTMTCKIPCIFNANCEKTLWETKRQNFSFKVHFWLVLNRVFLLPQNPSPKLSPKRISWPIQKVSNTKGFQAPLVTGKHSRCTTTLDPKRFVPLKTWTSPQNCPQNGPQNGDYFLWVGTGRQGLLQPLVDSAYIAELVVRIEWLHSQILTRDRIDLKKKNCWWLHQPFTESVQKWGALKKQTGKWG